MIGVNELERDGVVLRRLITKIEGRLMTLANMEAAGTLSAFERRNAAQRRQAFHDVRGVIADLREEESCTLSSDE